MVLGAQPALFWLWFCWQLFPIKDLLFYSMFPLFFFIDIIILILGSLIVAKIFLIVAKLFHKPIEGVFEISKKDKDYASWSLRAIIRKWPLWLARQLSLPSLEILVTKFLGVDLSFSSSIHEAWIDSEFIQIGKNVKLGQGCIIASNLLVKNKLIIKKVVIGDNVIVGAHCVINAGSNIASNAVLHSNTMTTINQQLKLNTIYQGAPAESFGNNNLIHDKNQIEKQIFKIDKKDTAEELRTREKELSVPFFFYVASGFSIVGFSFVLPGLLFFLSFYGYAVPTIFNNTFTLTLFTDWNFYVAMLLIPLILIGIYLLHLFFIILFTRWWYRLADSRGPSQGIFDRDMEMSSTKLDYYHFGSFLMKYPIFAVSRSPFPWILNWELNFIRSNKIGKGTVLEETFIHSHVNFGKYCYLGTSSHMTNHVVDGVYGEENLTFVGIEIDDHSILNVVTGGLPGTEMGKYATFLPGATTIKYDKVGDNGVYGGFPAKKLSKEEILYLLGGEYDGE
jgi:acetyltransferase-like isoleucine patch superfamily enzyme